MPIFRSSAVPEYNYRNRYYADFSVRADASSRFGRNNRWAGFWSLGLMWNARQRRFLQNVDWLTNAQVAFSTGTSGNSSIPNFDHLALVSGGPNYDGSAGTYPSQSGNESLTWEKTWSTNPALRLGFFDRANLEVEFYNKKTTDMLMLVPESYGVTGEGQYWDNIGAMVNRGVEINVNGDVFRTKNFVWNLNANVSYNRNKSTELYGGVTEYVNSTTGLKYQVGHEVGEYFFNRFAGVNPPTAMPSGTRRTAKSPPNTAREGQGDDRQVVQYPVDGRLRHDAFVERDLALGSILVDGRPLGLQQRPLFRGEQRQLFGLQPVEAAVGTTAGSSRAT